VQIAPERFASRRDTLAFLICIVLSLAARVAPVEVQRAVASGITETVLAPFLAIQEQVELMKGAGARVTQMAAAHDSISAIAFQSLALREENERLRELLDLSARMTVQHVSAEVLPQSLPTDGMTLRISVGRSHGVDVMDPVIAPGGIVGVIQQSDPSTSVVLVWTHPDFRASAMTGDGTIFGIVAARGSEGPYTALMELRGVPFRQDVAMGSIVYTSGRGIGLGGVYPRGIKIGTVMAVGEERREGWSSTYVVRPAVHPASLSHVVVLTGTIADVSPVFEDVGQ